MRTTTLAALVTACALPLTALSALPAQAQAEPPASVIDGWAKVVCREDGKTRVRVRVETTGKPLIDYRWQIAGRDAHVGDVLVDGGRRSSTTTLLAFTVPAGAKAAVSAAYDTWSFGKTVRARGC